ncbi:MAG: hypothetical protein KDA89_19820, partial [Planctomycetaceae bacterium]|nr:hypothetical protein [Planctomycetaceae bacterium]
MKLLGTKHEPTSTPPAVTLPGFSVRSGALCETSAGAGSSTKTSATKSASQTESIPPKCSPTTVVAEFSRALATAFRNLTDWEDVQAACAAVLQRSAHCSFVG